MKKRKPKEYPFGYSATGWKSRKKCTHLKELGLPTIGENVSKFTEGYKENPNVMTAAEMKAKGLTLIPQESKVEVVKKSKRIIKFEDE